MFPVLNSAGNMVGMIPKNFLIVLVKNHFWVDESQLTEKQKLKLPRLYRTLSGNANPNNMEDFNMELQKKQDENADFTISRRPAVLLTRATVT